MNDAEADAEIAALLRAAEELSDAQPDETGAAPDAGPTLSGRARSLANLLRGPRLDAATRAEAARSGHKQRLVTRELESVLRSKEEGQSLTWARRVALGCVRKAAAGDSRMVEVILNRVEGPAAGAVGVGAGGATFIIGNMVQVGVAFDAPQASKEEAKPYLPPAPAAPQR